MTRVLVLGSTGMLGHMVLDTLRAAPAPNASAPGASAPNAPALDIEGTQRARPGAEGYLDAEAGPEPVRALLGRSRYDYAINCIGLTKPRIDERDAGSVQRSEAVNARFPHELAAAAAEAGTRVIHVSTDAVFLDDGGTCFEDTPPAPSGVYGRTKLAGELSEEHTLTLRCSIVGPDPAGGRGLLEWFLAQPDGAEVTGYTDHRWSGVTTLQLADLVRELIVRDGFERVRAAAPVHHVCPNEPLSKHALLVAFGAAFAKRVTVAAVPGPKPALTRVLGTRLHALDGFYGDGIGLEGALARLADLNLMHLEQRSP